ncbi:MAG: hypothetical protein U0S48_08900 [Solirubrobacteraceae bacterium]
MTRTGEHIASLLAVAAPDGPPSVALLSRGEVLTLSETALRLALHANSGTATNLARTNAATLLRVEPGSVETLVLRTVPLGGAVLDGTELVLFEAAIVTRRHHAVTYATVTSGIAFTLHDEQGVLDRWQRTQALLRAAETPA